MSGWLSLFFSMVVAATSPGDVVVVRPSAWASALQDWKAYREQEGYRVIEIEPAATASETRTRIADSLAKSPPLNTLDVPSQHPFVVLMSDCPGFGSKKTPEDRIPVFYVESKVVKNFGSEPIIPSDQPYADWNDDGQFDAVVGRIPANSRDELQRYLGRVLQYERHTDRKIWSRKINVVAGVGDFGIVADTLIEGVARQLLTNDLPEIYCLSMTQASSKSNYCPAPSKFCDTVIKRLNDGGLFWVYLGHGFVDTLDYLQFVEPPMPILNSSMVDSISIKNGPPIAILLACYVAAFDASEPCLAERMLLHTDGPIAIIGGTRVTMPYAMGVLGGELIRQSFIERRDCVGTMLSQAKQSALIDNSSIEDDTVQEPSTLAKLTTKSSKANLATTEVETERAARKRLMDAMAKALSPEGHSLIEEKTEHSYLFNLLGDPLIRIHHPEVLDFELPASVLAGEKLVVHATSPGPGAVRCEIAYRRTRSPDRLKELRRSPDTRYNEALQQQIYEAANDLTIAATEQRTDGGRFELVFPIDSKLRGTYQVHLVLEQGKSWWAGSKEFQVIQPKPNMKNP
jgi:Peptidase family C25